MEEAGSDVFCHQLLGMSLADYYRVLGLRSGAEFEAVKTAYRRLARKYHPDVNPGDQTAEERFIRVTQAYRALADVLAPEGASLDSAEDPAPTADPEPPPVPKPQVAVNPQLSDAEQQLKQTSYEQLQRLFREQRFPRAIALVEGLSKRMPRDPEVRQWQAITYQRWGRFLIAHQQSDKARIYLKKALSTDPHNRSLWREVNQDFRRLEQTP